MSACDPNYGGPAIPADHVCVVCGHRGGNHLDDGCHRDASRCPCSMFVDSGMTRRAWRKYEAEREKANGDPGERLAAALSAMATQQVEPADGKAWCLAGSMHVDFNKATRVLIYTLRMEEL